MVVIIIIIILAHGKPKKVSCSIDLALILLNKLGFYRRLHFLNQTR